MKRRVGFPLAAHLLLHDERGRVLFQRRRSTGYADGQWSVPAGHVEARETLHDACVREALEEVGVRLRAQDLALACIQQKHDTDGEDRLDAFFTAVLPPGAVARIQEPGRSDALEWAQPASPPQPLVPYVAAALRHTVSGGPVLAYFGLGPHAACGAR